MLNITLDNVDLTGCVHSWRLILESIRDKSLIDSIDIIYCTFDGRVLFFGDYSKDWRISIPTESHKFREELDAVIRAL